MREISITYTTMKLLAGRVALFYQTRAVGYALFCTSDRFFATCNLLDPSEIADFEATLKTTATSVDNADDAYVHGYIDNGNAMILPKAADGRLATLPNCFPLNYFPVITGAGDDAVLGIGAGAAFRAVTLNQPGANDVVVKFTFNDPIEIAGGMVMFGTGTAANVTPDTFDYYFHALATATTSTPGAGNCNLTGSLIVPVASGGSNTVNLSTAQPVPNSDNTGWFDWTAPVNGVGAGAISVNLTQTGAYDLFTADKMVCRYVVAQPLMGAGTINFIVPAISPTLALPQWEHVATLHNSGSSHALNAVWGLAIGRTKRT